MTIIVDKMDPRAGRHLAFPEPGQRRQRICISRRLSRSFTATRIVYTFELEGLPGHVQLGIVTFEELNGKTKLTEKSVFESVGDRDGMLKSGMEEGSEIMDRLAELVEKK